MKFSVEAKIFSNNYFLRIEKEKSGTHLYWAGLRENSTHFETMQDAKTGLEMAHSEFDHEMKIIPYVKHRTLSD